MGVQAIHHQMPLGCLWNLGNRGLNMEQKVDFSAAIADAGSGNLSTDEIETGNQGLGAMPNVLKLPSLRIARSHGQVFDFALKSLNARHLVDTNAAFSLFSAFVCRQVDLTDVADLGIEVWVGGGLSQ